MVPSVTRGLPERSQMRADAGEAVTLAAAATTSGAWSHAMLEQQPAAARASARGARRRSRPRPRDRWVRATSAIAGSAAKLRQRRIAGGDVGRVGDDQVESLAGQPRRTRNPAASRCGRAAGFARIAAARPRAPAARHRRAVIRHRGPFGGDGQGDCAAAGAEIEHRALRQVAGAQSCSASSTSSSVSGRGTSTAGVTRSGSDQNSRRARQIGDRRAAARAR